MVNTRRGPSKGFRVESTQLGVNCLSKYGPTSQCKVEVSIIANSDPQFEKNEACFQLDSCDFKNIYQSKNHKTVKRLDRLLSGGGRGR